MRIKRLDICGFKSFMERTVFVFDDGVTGIVGPNGCGKSNVVDAIRWVMGEQSAKHLRGRSMEDVIFNGSERHQPLGMAEVSITFHNDRGEVPAQYAALSEITVTRRLFRNGDSEYLINKAACRLLDIVELFLGTGVGTKAYSIIEQGRIGLIVSAKPEDRRSLIEEAAGVTKYKARRKAAERKMEYTEQNLLRVGDILGELGKRLEALDRQARKAEKYKRLKGEMRGIELHLASLRLLELHALRASCEARKTELDSELAELSTAVDSAESGLAEARAALSEEAARLTERAEALAGLETGAALNQTNLEFYGRERDQLLARRVELAEERDTLQARLLSLEEEEVAAAAQAGARDGLQGEERARLEELGASLAQARTDEQDAVAGLESERAGAMEVLSEAASRKGELITVDRRRGDLVDRLARLQGEDDGLAHEAARLERERAALAARAGERRQLQLELELRQTDTAEAELRVRQEHAEAEAELSALREELADKRSRLQSLLEIQRSYEGYDRGVRAVIARGGEAGLPPGVHGLVSDLLETGADHERAIEAVLGERLQGVVVDGHALASELCRYLAEAREGRSTFLPLSLRAAEPLAAPEHPAVVARAVDVVTSTKLEAPLVAALLGDVCIVRDLESALELWALGGPHTFVTLGGEVVAPSGAVTGGDVDGPGAGLLQKRREVAELTEVVRALEARLSVAAERHKRLSRHADELEQSLKEMQQTGHAEELGLVHVERDLTRLTEELARVRARGEQLAHEKEELDGSLALLDAEAETARGAAAQAEAERGRREERIAALSATLSGLRARVTELDLATTDLKIQAAADAERREAVQKTLHRLRSERAELEDRRAKAAALGEELQGRLEALESRVEEASGSVRSLADELVAAREALAGERHAHAARNAAISERDEGLKGDRSRLKEVAAAAGEAGSRDRELALELSHLIDGVKERHNLSLQEQLSDYHLLPPPPAGSDERLRTLREQVERMGEVNLTAVEEHEELQSRRAFLAKQKEDLEQSLASLRQAITRIDRTSRERFEQTFAIINEKFQQVFPRLFAGGKAALVLTAPETPGGEAGVEILAQPPGKKLQSVGLMSGGEKALTAVSLIFSIFLIKPTPFCLLDEVDAPLDDANVGRYNDMVREMSRQSQFILITHNKNTMEIGDTLYGVTMEEPGISKTVSVRFASEKQAVVA